MSTPTADDTTQDALSAARTTSTREAAKWLIGSAAAVGVSMLAGSQLSSIGELDPRDPRLWLALGGAVVALACVSVIVFRAAGLLAPITLPESEFERHWQRPDRRWKPVKRFFVDNPRYLQGATSFVEMMDERRQLAVHYAATGSTTSAEALELCDERISHVLVIARDRRLQGLFRDTMLTVVALTSVAAAAITLFVWAANPPELTPPSLVDVDLSGASLRDADLTGADLTGADLTGADLTGADLGGAVLDGVVWTGATCPDGTTAAVRGADDAVSCRGRL